MVPPQQQELGHKQRFTSATAVTIVVSCLLLVMFGAHLLLRGWRVYPPDPRWTVHGGDPQRGREAILHYGCGSCHVIPGIRNATGRVGPQLTDFRIQTYIAGVLPNNPDNLVLWIQNPPKVNPLTAMPKLGVSREEAADIASYLYEHTRRSRRPNALP